MSVGAFAILPVVAESVVSVVVIVNTEAALVSIVLGIVVVGEGVVESPTVISPGCGASLVLVASDVDRSFVIVVTFDVVDEVEAGGAGG